MYYVYVWFSGTNQQQPNQTQNLTAQQSAQNQQNAQQTNTLVAAQFINAWDDLARYLKTMLDDKALMQLLLWE